MTLTDYLAKSLAYGIGLFLALGLTMAYVWYSTPYNYDRGTSAEIMENRPHAKGTVDYVIEKSKCVEHSGDKLPTGVVFQDKTGRAHYSESAMVIGKALDEEIDGIAWKNSTNIFCE